MPAAGQRGGDGVGRTGVDRLPQLLLEQIGDLLEPVLARRLVPLHDGDSLGGIVGGHDAAADPIGVQGHGITPRAVVRR
ncbi:hypothetical protein D3C84_1198900 [compost metagenome]